MPRKADENERDLPRFLERVALTRGLLRPEPTKTSIGAIGVLHPFTGPTGSRIGAGHRRFPDLSYLVLRQLVVGSSSETVREIPPLTGLHDESRRREEPASNAGDSEQFLPLTRLIARAVKRRTSQQPLSTVTNTVGRIERTVSFPSTIPSERRIHRYIQTDDSADSRSLRRDSSEDRTGLRERSGEMGRTAFRHNHERTMSRQTGREGPEDRDRLAVGLWPPERGSRAQSDDRHQGIPPSSAVTKTLAGARADSNETTAHRERGQYSTRQTAMTVLTVDNDDGGDDKSVRGVGSDARAQRSSDSYSTRTGTTLVSTPNEEAPSPHRSPVRTPERTPTLTVRAGRANPGPSEREESGGRRDAERVNGDTSHEGRGDGEFDNSIEQHIYPPESMHNRHMDTDADIDRLVDRLFTRFERKLRIERERRGL